MKIPVIKKKSNGKMTLLDKLLQPDVRVKLLWTVLLLLIYRLGCAITIPFVNSASLQNMFGSISILDYYNLISGGALSQCAVFAIGVTAYINASIIMQLLTVAIPKLEEISKDYSGHKQIEKITQYVGCGISAITALGYFFIMKNYGAMRYTSGWKMVVEAFVVVSVLMSGAQLVVWLGWKIDEKGIGNGVSLIIFTGIISRWNSVISLFKNTVALAQTVNKAYYLMIPGVILFVLAATWYVVHTNDAERRIPVQYAGKNSGRTPMAGQRSYIPIKLIMSGVMPIIFASTVCSLPSLVLAFIKYSSHPKLYTALSAWNSTNIWYIITYIVLIFLFNIFYISITFDPIAIANNLRKNGASIPGIRPGRATSDYIDKASRTLANSGSFVLSVIACVPIIVSAITGLNLHLGGTSLLIVSGVALGVIDFLNSQLVAHHHEGFLN